MGEGLGMRGQTEVSDLCSNPDYVKKEK